MIRHILIYITDHHCREKYQDMIRLNARLEAGEDVRLKPATIRKKVSQATETYFEYLKVVQRTEDTMGLDQATRWASDSEEYLKGIKEINETAYRRALDRVALLVVQRLLELVKIGLPGTGACSCSWWTSETALTFHGVGYKMRKKIGEGLKNRSTALSSAVAEYNVQAKKLNPPRPSLEFSQVMSYAFLAEFDLLRDVRTDIRELPWTRPALRTATIVFLKMERAKEEICRVNIEAKRLKTWIRDQRLHRHQVIAEKKASNPWLAAELAQRDHEQNLLDVTLLRTLHRMECLKGYSGSRMCGVRLGGMEVGDGASDETWAGADDEIDDEGVDDPGLEVGDDVGEKMDKLEEFASAVV